MCRAPRPSPGRCTGRSGTPARPPLPPPPSPPLGWLALCLPLCLAGVSFCRDKSKSTLLLCCALRNLEFPTRRQRHWPLLTVVNESPQLSSLLPGAPTRWAVGRCNGRKLAIWVQLSICSMHGAPGRRRVLTTLLTTLHTTTAGASLSASWRRWWWRRRRRTHPRAAPSLFCASYER